jgi:NADPH:quinone reductase-like Zn-dependent oxidoreductase
VICTASPRSASELKKVGASEVIDYRSPDVLQQLTTQGPYKYIMTASGDPHSQSTIAALFSPTGGRFASVLPLSSTIRLPFNVEIVYTAFSQAAQKDEYAEFRSWWYGSYLPSVLSSGSLSSVGYTKVNGGLAALLKASQDVFDGRVRGKVIIDPQE